MKVGTATTLLFATLALASPAPLARPEPAPVAQLMEVESRDQPSANLVARISSLIPEIYARASSGSGGSGGGKSSSSSSSSSKSSKPKAPKGGSGNNTESAAISVTPSQALQLGAIGLVVAEVAIQWS